MIAALPDGITLVVRSYDDIVFVERWNNAMSDLLRAQIRAAAVRSGQIELADERTWAKLPLRGGVTFHSELTYHVPTHALTCGRTVLNLPL